VALDERVVGRGGLSRIGDVLALVSRPVEVHDARLRLVPLDVRVAGVDEHSAAGVLDVERHCRRVVGFLPVPETRPVDDVVL